MEKEKQLSKSQLLRRGCHDAAGTFRPGNWIGRADLKRQRLGLTVRLLGAQGVVNRRLGVVGR